jgi:hypothetical protein
MKAPDNGFFGESELYHGKKKRKHRHLQAMRNHARLKH